MDPDRRRKIQELFEAALKREPDARGAFLTAACGEDEELRREAASLLARHEAPDPALPGDPTVTQLAPGVQIGAYRIESKLGAGGMGQVYRATDTRLGRPVAIKISYEQFSGRFAREARAIAQLKAQWELRVRPASSPST